MFYICTRFRKGGGAGRGDDGKRGWSACVSGKKVLPLQPHREGGGGKTGNKPGLPRRGR